ncbi:MAG TPA: hypothetical protein VL970_13510, partial [Candidatus Acidoferrales bacterium]|nr:hypothetical protein [Candidatus Acidoferrales bacterium]
LVGYSVGIVQTWFFFHLLHQDATWIVASSAWFLGMWFDLLTFAIPQNLGTLEGTRVLVLQTFGYTALMGVAYGFALRLAQIIWSCVGLAFYALLVSRVHQPRSAIIVLEPASLNACQTAPAGPSRWSPLDRTTSLQERDRQ